MVIKRRFNGRVKTCCIHDLLWNSVQREAEKEKFLYVARDHVEVLPEEPYSIRRLILHTEIVASVEHKPSVCFTYSFLCCTGAGLPPSTSQLRSFIGFPGFKLLRVLDLGYRNFFTFPMEIAPLVNLRYLMLNCYDELPSSISEHCHLKTLIIPFHLEGLALPADIWNMPHLRHVRFKRGCTVRIFMAVSAPDDGKNSLVLLNLHTLSYISFGSCSREVFGCIPKLKELGIHETEKESMTDEHMSYYLDNLNCIEGLETLKCRFVNPMRIPLQNFFPSTLKKLTLRGSHCPWEEISVLSSLPELIVLKLKDFAFQGTKWKANEMVFSKLKFLLLGKTDLMHWDAGDVNSPNLQRLVLWSCQNLAEIPDGIGDIPTLELVELYGCGSSANDSAKRIQQEQQQYMMDSS